MNKMKQPKLKIGQKYRVIEDCNAEKYNGKIVRVNEIDTKNGDGFWNKKGSYFDFNLDELQLIKPKSKKVKKWKYSREEALEQIYHKPLFTLDKSELMGLVGNIENDLLATKPKPVKEEGCNFCKDKNNVGECPLCGKENTNSKDIEFEEIKKLNFRDFFNVLYTRRDNGNVECEAITEISEKVDEIINSLTNRK